MRNTDAFEIFVKLLIKMAVQNDEAVHNIQPNQIPQLFQSAGFVGGQGQWDGIIILFGSFYHQKDEGVVNEQVIKKGATGDQNADGSSFTGEKGFSALRGFHVAVLQCQLPHPFLGFKRDGRVIVQTSGYGGLADLGQLCQFPGRDHKASSKSGPMR